MSEVFDKDEMDYYVGILEDKLGRSFQDGRNECVRSMRPALGKVEVVHRPLLWYLVSVLMMQRLGAKRAAKIIMGLDFATYLSLYFIGLRHYATPFWFSSFPFRPHTIVSRTSGVPTLSYWHKEHTSKQKHPLIYIHGIGVRVRSFPSISRLSIDILL